MPFAWLLAKDLGLRRLVVLRASLFGFSVLVNGEPNGHHESEHEQGGNQI